MPLAQTAISGPWGSRRRPGLPGRCHPEFAAADRDRCPRLLPGPENRLGRHIRRRWPDPAGGCVRRCIPVIRLDWVPARGPWPPVPGSFLSVDGWHLPEAPEPAHHTGPHKPWAVHRCGCLATARCPAGDTPGRCTPWDEIGCRCPGSGGDRRWRFRRHPPMACANRTQWPAWRRESGGRPADGTGPATTGTEPAAVRPSQSVGYRCTCSCGAILGRSGWEPGTESLRVGVPVAALMKSSCCVTVA